MNNLKKFIPALCLFFFLPGCQRDDICPESTQVTPLLIIEFYDVEDNTRLKAVQNLVAHAIEEDTLLGPTTTNRIEIPLRTDQNNTHYRLIKNSGAETENVDTLSFFYTSSTEYLNRACGFKINYRGLKASIIEDEDNWILSELEQQIDVENDTEAAHVHITH